MAGIVVPSKKRFTEKGLRKDAERRAYILYHEYTEKRYGRHETQLMQQDKNQNQNQYDTNDKEDRVMQKIREQKEQWENENIENEEERFQKIVNVALECVENEEARARLSKHQQKLNQLRNAEKDKKLRNYNWKEEDEKWINKYKKKYQAPIAITEAVPVIRDALEAGIKGQKRLIQYLKNEFTQRQLEAEDVRVLLASMDAGFNGRKSPLSFRVEMMWRLCSTMQDLNFGNKELQLKLAVYGYQLMLEKIDLQKHPMKYAALHNSLTLAVNDLDRIECMEWLHRGNADFQFVPPDISVFEFNRKIDPEVELRRAKRNLALKAAENLDPDDERKYQVREVVELV